MQQGLAGILGQIGTLFAAPDADPKFLHQLMDVIGQRLHIGMQQANQMGPGGGGGPTGLFPPGGAMGGGPQAPPGMPPGLPPGLMPQGGPPGAGMPPGGGPGGAPNPDELGRVLRGAA
jgi:hypothetical protein